MMWPGIPEGKGSTCAEEGCGNPRPPRGNTCRTCYFRKYRAHRRASGMDLEHSWSEGGIEVGLTREVRRELDAKAYTDWRNMQDFLE